MRDIYENNAVELMWVIVKICHQKFQIFPIKLVVTSFFSNHVLILNAFF